MPNWVFNQDDDDDDDHDHDDDHDDDHDNVDSLIVRWYHLYRRSHLLLKHPHFVAEVFEAYF